MAGTITTHLTDEEKAAWKRYCRRHGAKEAQALRLVVLDAVDRDYYPGGYKLTAPEVALVDWLRQHGTKPLP